MKWKFTPWMHILCYHFFFFESQNVRPILLSCHAPEGHHRLLKRDFSHSLHSTKRRNKNSGLSDILCYDNIILTLITKGIFPWSKLKLNIGNNIKKFKKGQILNFIKNKYPISFPFENFNENDENEEILIQEYNSDYNPDDTSSTES